MAPSFGTSGLRGLVSDLTPELIADYTHAFLSIVKTNNLYIGKDLRPSSPQIAKVISETALDAGVNVYDCGFLGTPALALASMGANSPAIMVTGSHIPADRNGLKFYLPNGEVLKEDEAKITAAYTKRTRFSSGEDAQYFSFQKAETDYVKRYVDAFGKNTFSGLRIGIYRHSSVARDTLEKVFQSLGAEVVPLAHSETFVPVDTEAVDEQTRKTLHDWCINHSLHAIASTDGDADRPMLTDSNGRVVPGDILGILTAKAIGAKRIVTPISSNDMVRQIDEFDAVTFTKIGSPYVIEEMNRVGDAKVIGFEANGGFLLGYKAELKAPLPALKTRDCLLPILAPILLAKDKEFDLAALIATLPPRFTAADRIQNIDSKMAATFLKDLVEDKAISAEFFSPYGVVLDTNLIDGLRCELGDGSIIHLRPSGNAPEFRIYAQASSQNQANSLVSNVAVSLKKVFA